MLNEKYDIVTNLLVLNNVNAIRLLCLFFKIKYAILNCILDFFYTKNQNHCRSQPANQFKKRIDWRI